MTEINNNNTNNLTVEHPSAPTVRVYRPRPVAHFLRRLPVELRHEAVNYLCMLGLDAFASSGLLNHDAWQSLQVHSERTMENLRLLSKDIEPHINAHFRAISDAPENEEEADENNRSQLAVDPLISPGRTSSRHGRRSDERRVDNSVTDALKTESRMISPSSKRRHSTPPPPPPGNVATIIIENAANSPSAQRRREAQQHLENLRREETFLLKQLNGDDDDGRRRSSKHDSRTTSPLPRKSQFGAFENNNRLTSSTSPINRKKHIVSPLRSQSVEFTRIITPERDDPRQRALLLKTTNQSSYVRYNSSVYQQKYRMNNSNNINHGKKPQGSKINNNPRDESSFDEQTKPGVIAISQNPSSSTFVNQVNPRHQYQQQHGNSSKALMINKTTFPKKVPQYNETKIPGLASRTVNNNSNNNNQFYQQRYHQNNNNNNTAYLQKGFDGDEPSPHGLRSATIRGMAAKLKSEAEVLIKVATKMEHKNNSSRPSSAPIRHNNNSGDEQKNQVDCYVVKSPSRRHNEVPLKSHIISQRERLQSQRELGNDEVDANIVKAPPPPPAMMKKWKEQREMELEKLRQRELEKQEELKLLNDLTNNNVSSNTNHIINHNNNQKLDTPDGDDHQFPPISRELTSSAHYSNNNLNDQRQRHLLTQQQQQQQQQQIPAVQSKNISPFRRRTSDDATASVGGRTNNSTVGHNNSIHSISNNNLQLPHQHQQQQQTRQDPLNLLSQQQQQQRTPLSGGLIGLANVVNDDGDENMNAAPLAQTEKSFDELERSGISNRSTPRLERACKVALKLDTGEPVPIGAVPRRQQQQLQQQQQQQSQSQSQSQYQSSHQKQQRPFISPSRVAAESSMNENNKNTNTISPRRRNSYSGLAGNNNNNDDDVEDFENAVPVGSTTSPTPQEGKIKNASFFSESASTSSNQAQAASNNYYYPPYNYNGNGNNISQSNNVSNNTSGRLVLVNQQPMMMFSQNNNNNKIDVSPSRRGNSALDYVFDSALGSPGNFVGGHHALPVSLQQQQQQQNTRFSPSSMIQSKARSPLAYNNNNNTNSSSNRHQFSIVNHASNNNNINTNITSAPRPYPSTVFSSGGSGMFNNSSVLFGSNNGAGAGGNEINNNNNIVINANGIHILPQQDSLTQYPSFNGSIGLAGTNNNSLAGNTTPQQQSQRLSVNMGVPSVPANGNNNGNQYQSQYQSPQHPGNNSRKY